MTVKELEQLLDTTVLLLQENKNIATPEILDGLDNIVTHFGGTPAPVSFETNLQNILDGVTKVVNIERKLIKSTDDLVRILSNIQNHPIIMRLLARLL